MDWISNPDVWSALAALLLLEVVLGVDNVVFISILASRLPKEQQDRARRTGLIAAGGMRVVLLIFVGWIVTLEEDLFEVFDVGFSGKDLILLAGGVFLIYKATKEIHNRLEGAESHDDTKTATTFGAVIVQVLILDAVFSVDSVITAVGMTDYVGVMVAAVMISVGIMLFASKAIYEFVNDHPTVKMLALSFLLLIGVTLIAEGMGQKIPKGYIYSAIAFSLLVEGLNIRTRTKVEPVHLHEPYLERHNLPSPATTGKASTG
ncbi:MAG: TerC family protein [Actinomycetota bacterium]|nr:TerC family protein [Actinomycetota bacterium]